MRDTPNVCNGSKTDIAAQLRVRLAIRMSNKRKRIRRRAGDVLRISLGDGRHSYAQISGDPLIVFFDGVFSDDLSLGGAGELPVLFRIWVHDDAIRTGRWPVVGHAPLSAENAAEPFFYKQDLISGALSLYHSTFSDIGWERPASAAECNGLECAAVWDAEHVEDRLRDHYDGRPNKWLKSVAIDKRTI